MVLRARLRRLRGGGHSRARDLRGFRRTGGAGAAASRPVPARLSGRDLARESRTVEAAQRRGGWFRRGVTAAAPGGDNPTIRKEIREVYMSSTGVNAGGRLDRLPIARFHYRVFSLIGAGLFVDGFEIFLAGSILGALVQSGWSDLAHNARFISANFVGMLVGAWLAGLTGDRFGRKFAYQANLLIFGISALAAAAAPSMNWL